MAATVGGDIDLAFNTLDRDLTGHFVPRKGGPLLQDKSHDFQLTGLEQRMCSLLRELAAQRPNVDEFF